MLTSVIYKEKWFYKDYLKLEDDNRYEILGGNLSMVPAPNFNHQHLSWKLTMLLSNFIEHGNLGYIVTAPIDVILGDDNVVQPDILFISNENKKIIKKQGVFGAPDLVIEILSPSSQYRDVYEKKELYEKFKVEEYWMVNPYMKSIEVLTLNDEGTYRLYSEGFVKDSEIETVKTNVLKGLTISLKEVFKDEF